ncbi:MAG: restriction endonuclease subunit S [Oribacterium sp.]|nr:restriction endonuclease subunit S [Oribacterium sp.]
MIDTQALRNKILDLAINGSLPSFKVSGVDVNDSLCKALNERNIFEHVIKNPITFKIPIGWKWIKLGWIVDIDRGGSPRPIKDYLTTDHNGINWIKIGDVSKDGKYILSTKEKIKPEGEKKSRRVYPGDFLLTNSMSFGRPYICQIEGCIHDGWLVLRNSVGLFNLDFLYYLLSSSFVYNQFAAIASGSTVVNLNKDKVSDTIVPLPPLEDQKRIVYAINEIMPIVDSIKSFQNAYNHDSEVLKNSILNEAIEGKLVEQRPEEGTGDELYQQIQKEKEKLIKEGKIKKQKPLAEITEEEKPFEIPKNWKWVRWGNLSNSIQYGFNAPAKSQGSIKMVRISDIQDGKINWNTVPFCDISEDEISTYLLGKNDILFARTGGTVGKSYIVKDLPEKSIYAGYLIRTQYSSLLSPEYLYYFMKSNLYWRQLRSGTIATAQPNCNGQTLSKMLLPLPPLAEQKRIVAKLEELLPLCNQLK